MKRKKSILFLRPDYHCSFFYRDQLRELGWKADIFLTLGYPQKLLYSDEDILRAPSLGAQRIKLVKYINQVLLLAWFLTRFWRYEFHLYYGRPPVFNFMEKRVGLQRVFGKNFLVELWLAKLFGIKLIFLPNGCNEDESKHYNTLLDNGNLCGNCGSWNKCDDRLNNLNFAKIRNYFDMAIGGGTVDSSQFAMTHVKYKSIDLSLWSPTAPIPFEHQLPKTNRIRILHSAVLNDGGRNWQGRNVKGSPFVLAATERLKKEGHLVEYFFIEDKPSNQMRFYQAQADIVVEQLIYGWWGSTGVETMALGKPVVCYLRPSWKTFFLKTFPEYDSLPIIEADTNTIYDVLKKLVTDADYRRRKGEESRRFAEAHFDPVKNAKAFAKLLEAL